MTTEFSQNLWNLIGTYDLSDLVIQLNKFTLLLYFILYILMGQGASQSQNDRQEYPTMPQFDELRRSSPVVPYRIEDQQEKSSFSVHCPQCRHLQFDDGLGRMTKCTCCNLVYCVKDGIAEISQGHHELDEVRIIARQEYAAQSILQAVFYVNQSNLPSELIRDQKVDYKTLMKNVILPFFQIRQRMITVGLSFQVGNFQFRCVGGYPEQGIVTKESCLYCYDSYSNEPLASIKVFSDRRQSAFVEQEIKDYMRRNPNQNVVIQDFGLKINNNSYLVLECDRKSGRINNQSKIECVQTVQKLKQVKLGFSVPRRLRHYSNQGEQLKTAILKLYVQPYFTGTTRFVERAGIVTIGEIDFQIIMEDQCGLVVPNYTTIEVDSGAEYHRQIQSQGQLQQQLSLRYDPSLRSPYTRRSQLVQIQRSELNRYHVQQIEALHRLLSVYIMYGQGQQCLNLSNGASQSEIESLPVRQIDQDFLKKKQGEEDYIKCFICLSDYEDQEKVRTLQCLHYFHVHCIDKWLFKSNACPICKTGIQLQPHLEAE